MSRQDRRLRRYIDAIVRDRKPRRGPTGDDLPAMRLAARLHAAHPGSSEPSPAFIDQLARRLRHDAGATQVPMPERRRFLLAAGTAAAAGIGAGFGIEHLREATATATPAAQGTITPTDGAWVAVAQVAEMTVGTVKRFSSNGIEGFLLNNNGHISALSAVCTDQGCLLVANKSAAQLDCPCHYAQFDLQGTPKPGSYHKVTPLPAIQVRMNGEHVEALLPNLT